MDYYKRYMGDYGRDTSRLSMMEHGAYSLLLDDYYSTRAPLPADLEGLYRICRAMSKPEQGAVASVAKRFFPVGEDGLRHNNRADEEIAKWEVMAEENRQKGKLGGRPKKNPSGNPGGNQLGSGRDSPDETRLETNGVISGFEKGPFSKPGENPLQILSQKPKPEPHPQNVRARGDDGTPANGQESEGKPRGPDEAWRDVETCDVQAHSAWLDYRSQAGETVTPAQRLVNAKFLAGKGAPEVQRRYVDELIRLGFKRLHDPMHGNGNGNGKPTKEDRTHAGLPIVNP